MLLSNLKTRSLERHATGLRQVLDRVNRREMSPLDWQLVYMNSLISRSIYHDMPDEWNRRMRDDVGPAFEAQNYPAALASLQPLYDEVLQALAASRAEMAAEDKAIEENGAAHRVKLVVPQQMLKVTRTRPVRRNGSEEIFPDQVDVKALHPDHWVLWVWSNEHQTWFSLPDATVDDLGDWAQQWGR